MKAIKRIIFVLLILMTTAVLAHTPLLLVEDNGDGTLYAEAGFSDGSGAQGMTCRLEDADGKVLWEGKFDVFSSVEVDIPDSSHYYVVFDAGPGHIVKKEGPVKSGVKQVVAKETVEAAAVKPVQEPTQEVQQAPQSTVQPVAHNPNPVNVYPVREYSRDNNDFSGLTTHLTLITVFLGVIGLCLIFITVTLIILVSNKK